jgi:hypothetical protein
LSTFEIPSHELALHFARLARLHEIDFSRGDPLPLCRKCERPIHGDQWAAMEECPGRVTE